MSYGKYSNYRRDPRWISAKFNSVCDCGSQIKRGERIYYYPATRTAVCEKCGKIGEISLRAEVSMDQYGTDIF